MRAKQAMRYLWASAGAFLAGVGACVVLRSADALGHNGISVYGNFPQTFLPYGIGLSAAAYFVIRACQALRDTSIARDFRIGLEAIALAALGIVATPSLSVFWWVQDLHVLFGMAIFVTQAVLSLGYLINSWMDRTLLGLQLIAIVFVGLSFRELNVVALMLPAQTLAIVSFGALLIRWLRRELLAGKP